MKKAQLIKRSQLTDNVIDLEFEAKEKFDFQAGQYISVKIDDVEKSACFRAYSIASAPNGQTFNLCIKVLEKSRGSNWVNTLQEGDEIQFMGPMGKFIFNENSEKNTIFIATGTGIAPFKSIIEDRLKNNDQRKMHLFFGVRHIKGIFYQDFFENMMAKYPNFSYTLTLSQPENKSWQGNKGRVTEILKNTELDNENTEFYLCGLSNMIDETTKILQEKGASPENIHFEKYD